MPTGSAANPTTTLRASLTTSEKTAHGEAGLQRGWTLADAIPGRTIRHPGGRTVGETEHVWLAWLTHNVSDIHGNADAAARGAWGQPLVLGMLTAAIVVGLAEPAMGPPVSAVRSLGQGWDAIALECPVVAGSTLTAESYFEHVEVGAGSDEALVRRTIVGRDQTDAVVVRIRETRRLPNGRRRRGR